MTLQPLSRAPVLPKVVANLLAKLSQNVWWPALSPDEVTRRYIDDVDITGDWDVVGVQPSEIESHAIKYLRRYRSAYVAFSSFVWIKIANQKNRENYVRPTVLPPRPTPVAVSPLIQLFLSPILILFQQTEEY